jgi:hypothetical protein
MKNSLGSEAGPNPLSFREPAQFESYAGEILEAAKHGF